jgi:hypothetical protein
MTSVGVVVEEFVDAVLAAEAVKTVRDSKTAITQHITFIFHSTVGCPSVKRRSMDLRNVSLS